MTSFLFCGRIPRRFLFGWIGIVAFCMGFPAMAAIHGPVQVSGGLVEGLPSSDPRISMFLGIPYGAPPVGELRWRPPQPPASWSGVRKADHFCASCIQNIVAERKPWTHEFMAHNEISEDCLFLNVWTPARSSKERHPVFFWIHGGGNNEGSSTVPVYDGEGLAKKGLVVVVINYRLGVLGWMSHPELTRESPQHASGNYGLLDQIAALRWVHDNIAAFGGDPGNVTVAGQSAGAGAVHNLTASPLAKGLFHRAIAESGSGVVGFPPRTTADQEQDGLRFATAKGAKSLAELRAMTWSDLVAPVPGTTPNAATGATAGWRFGPVVDGYALPLSVRETFARGQQNDVPTLTGGNADEGGAEPKPNAKLDDYKKQAKQRFGDRAEAYLALYPAGSDAEAGAARNAAARDQSRESTYLWALQRAHTARTKVYTYFWNHALPGPDAATYGAFHTSEVPYALNTLDKSDRPFTAADHKIADTVSSYWVNFATKGDPNGRGLPYWPAVSAKAALTMQLGDATGPIPVAGSEAKLKFLEQVLMMPAPTGARP
jgi:para-nitrobenzyl esterase